MVEPDIGWHDIFPEPFVALVLGARGEGKTALAHRLIEEFEAEDKDAYIMGFPQEKEDRLPDWIDVLPPATSMEVWPTDSIVLIHEAHHLLHARRSMDAENLELDKLVTVSRHRNSSIIYDTQQSQRLDRNSVAAVDAICVRWPALMQEDFERRAIRPIIEDARGALEKYVTVHDDGDYEYVEFDTNGDGVEKLKKHVYVHADHFVGEYPHEVDLAGHWSEEISKAYGPGGGDEKAYGSKPKSLDEIREDMADPDDIEEQDVDEVLDMLSPDDEAPDDGGTDTATGGETVAVDAEDSGGGGAAAETTTETTTTDDSDDDDEETPRRGDVTADSFNGPIWPVEDGEWYFISAGGRKADGKGPYLERPGIQYIERMVESGNRVSPNQFGEPIVEIVVPRGSVNEVRQLVKNWDINPQGPTTRPSPPSFHEERPRIAEGLTAFHFHLDPNGETVKSSGYDVRSIVESLQESDEPYLVTASPQADAILDDHNVFEK